VGWRFKQGGQVRPQYAVLVGHGTSGQRTNSVSEANNRQSYNKQKGISRGTHLNTGFVSRTSKLTEIRILLSQTGLQATFKIFGQSLQNLLENKQIELVLNSLDMNTIIGFVLLPFLISLSNQTWRVAEG
jgi:hypothetical protein